MLASSAQSQANGAQDPGGLRDTGIHEWAEAAARTALSADWSSS